MLPLNHTVLNFVLAPQVDSSSWFRSSVLAQSGKALIPLLALQVDKPDSSGMAFGADGTALNPPGTELLSSSGPVNLSAATQRERSTASCTQSTHSSRVSATSPFHRRKSFVATNWSHITKPQPLPASLVTEVSRFVEAH
jgi:hypothetical protein